MKAQIVEYLRLKAATIGGVNTHLGIHELRTNGNGQTVPYAYAGGDDLQPLDIDNGSVGYFRTYQREEFTPVDGMRAERDISGTFYIRYAAILHRDTRDHVAYAEDVANALTGVSSDLKSILKARTVNIQRASIETDITRAWREEFTTSVSDLPYHLGMVLVDFTVTVTGSRDCWQGCSELADILQGFDWCNPATLARLTPAQVACIAEQIPCDDAFWELFNTDGDLLSTGSIASGDTDTIIAPDATVTRDGQPFGSVPSGGSIDVPSVVTPCADADLEINGTSVGVVASGATRDLPVLQDGLPSGSWNGTQWIIPSCPPPSSDWVRPSEWIAIPNLTSADERGYFLVVLFENAYNALGLAITNLAANIDWGDGTSVVSNGLTQTKIYDYSTVASPVNVWPDGRNYKQVMVDITRVGGAIASMNWTNALTVNARGNNNVVDAIFSFPSLTTCQLSQSAISGTRAMSLLQRLRVRDTGLVTAWHMTGLTGLLALEWDDIKGNIPNDLFATVQVIDMATLNITAANALRLFGGSRIRKVGTVTGNALTSATASRDIFALCPVLEEVGAVTMTSATNIQALFSGCSSLTKVGLITAPNVQVVSQVAINCFLLEELIFSDCAAVTTTTFMVSNCVSLTNLVMPGLTIGINLGGTGGTAMGNYGMGNFSASLGIAAGAQTITVTGTPYGALLAALDPTAVAHEATITGKGFTVAN